MFTRIGDRARRLLGVLVCSGDVSGDREFATHARDLSLRAVRVMAIVTVLGPLWSILECCLADAPVLASPQTGIRLLLAACAAALLAIERRHAPTLRRWIYAIVILGTAAAGVLVGAGLGSQGGVERPSFAVAYVYPLITTVLVVCPLGLRVVAVALAAAGLLAGFFGLSAQPLDHPFIGSVLELMLFSVGISILLGHVITRLLRSNFGQARALAEHARTLAARIAERTEELRNVVGDVESTRDAERRRIARELHDDLGQILTLMRLELDLAAAPGLDRARLERLVERAHQAVRAVVMDLRPPELDEHGLAAAVTWLMTQHEATTAMECAWLVEIDDALLDPGARAAVFRALQEALTNVARHAHARQVEVELRQDGDSLVLMVRDDGVGFAAGAGAPRPGFGLLGMRERAALLGGRLELRSGPGEGTIVRMIVPQGGARAEVNA